MKKTARVLSTWMVVFFAFTGFAFAQPPMTISPGAGDGTAIVISGCPSFSWSEVEDAVSYQIVVFEPNGFETPISYGEISLSEVPVLEQTIQDRGFSWTPSADSCLLGGVYVWFVAGLNIEGAAEWSDGRVFKVDALAGFDAVSGEKPDAEAASGSKSLNSTGADESVALSIEQIIHSNVALEILSTSGVANESSSEEIVLMELEGEDNTLFGKYAGNSISGGTGNAFFGRSAGYWNDDNGKAQGDRNTFIGHHAGNQNKYSDDNTFVGYQAGYHNTGGYNNTFIGGSAGDTNISGGSNTFIGQNAGQANTSAGNNTFIGQNAGQANNGALAENNTFIGQNAGQANTSGSSNTFIGQNAGQANNSGYGNIFIGLNAGHDNITADNNTFVGRSAGYKNTASGGNSFLGYQAGFDNTGSSNTFIGSYAGQNNSSGYYNTFVGNGSGYIHSTGHGNTFIGNWAGGGSDFSTENTGEDNTFIGLAAGRRNTTGSFNALIGKDAGLNNKTGSQNAFLGTSAGQANTVGLSNAFIGYKAGYSNTSGLSNTFLGTLAGHQNTTGNLNVFIGSGAGYSETGSNKLYIENSQSATPLIYGEFDNNIVKINGQLQMLASASSSDLRLKKDIKALESSLDKVLELQGVSYQWKTDEYPDWGFKETKQIGLVAQEVETVLPELVSTDSMGYKAVSYDKLTAVLVEAVKELKAENEKLKEQLDEIRAFIRGLKG